MRNLIDRARCGLILAAAAVMALGLFTAQHVRAAAVELGHRANDAVTGYLQRTGLVAGVVQWVQLLPFTNVVASGVAVCDLKNLFGYSIERIVLQLGGGAFTKAMITSLQIKANGKVIYDSTGSRTDTRMAYRGITANASFLVVDFTELKLKTKLGQLGGSLDTSFGIKDLRIEVTTSGATTPTLVGFAKVTPPQQSADFKNFRPLIARVHSLTQTIGAAGTFSLSIPHMDPNSGGSIFKRIALFSSNCTGARVERNGIREWELVNKASNDFVQVEYGRATQAGLWMIDFVVDGFQEDRLLDTRPVMGTTTAAVYGTFSAGETITAEVETLEPLDVY